MTLPALSGWLLGFVPGPRELALVVLVVAALYGRSALAWLGSPARRRRPPGRDRVGLSALLVDRWPRVVVLLAWTALAGWLLTRMTIASRPAGP